MTLIDTPLRDVKLIHPKRYADDRGWFAETFQSRSFSEVNLPETFVQENQSFSRQWVLRGLHYQLGEPQGKLVRVLTGAIWDVAVDLRRDSPDFGKWAGFHLKAEDGELLWIPEGFAHGFLVLSQEANVLYKTTGFYFPAGERCIRWDDPELAIDWPLASENPIVSAKDALGVSFAEAELPPVHEDDVGSKRT